MDQTPEVQMSEDEQRPASSGKKIGAVVIVLLLLGGAGFGYWWWTTHQAPAPVAVQAPPPPAPAPAPAVNPADGDAMLRGLAAKLSPAKELSEWLAQPDIVRRLVAATNMISEGKTPRSILSFVNLSGDYTVERRNKQLFASAASAARYDTVTRVVTSIDVNQAAAAYAQVKPYVQAAWGEIGPPNTTFDSVLHGAIGHLTATAIPATPPALQEHGALYEYVDPQLEALSGAQKQLLRMGQKNGQAVQDWLKKLDAALTAAH